MSYDVHINTFHMRGVTGKAQAVKVLEESAEVYSEWQRLCETMSYCKNNPIEYPNTLLLHVRKERFENEIADCMQALANLADMYDIDLEAAMRRCDRRNEARGRL